MKLCVLPESFACFSPSRPVLTPISVSATIAAEDFDLAMTAMDYVDGQARYVACVPNKGTYGRTLKARLTIPTAGHLYECRTGKYLGNGPTGRPLAGREWPAHDVELREATGSIFALLPYRVERLDLSAPPAPC